MGFWWCNVTLIVTRVSIGDPFGEGNEGTQGSSWTLRRVRTNNLKGIHRENWQIASNSMGSGVGRSRPATRYSEVTRALCRGLATCYTTLCPSCTTDRPRQKQLATFSRTQWPRSAVSGGLLVPEYATINARLTRRTSPKAFLNPSKASILLPKQPSSHSPSPPSQTAPEQYMSPVPPDGRRSSFGVT
jgi:hypothetical protein